MYTLSYQILQSTFSRTAGSGRNPVNERPYNTRWARASSIAHSVPQQNEVSPVRGFFFAKYISQMPPSKEPLPCERPHQQDNDAEQEHKDRNLIDSVHHSEIDVALLFSEKVGRIEVVHDFLEEHKAFGRVFSSLRGASLHYI